MNRFFKNYQHPQWQRRKSERMMLADFKCERCGNDREILHVHHPKYKRGAKPWEYADHELEVLCATCHTMHHDGERRIHIVEATEDQDDFYGAWKPLEQWDHDDKPRFVALARVALAKLAGWDVWGDDRTSVYVIYNPLHDDVALVVQRKGHCWLISRGPFGVWQ